MLCVLSSSAFCGLALPRAGFWPQNCSFEVRPSPSPESVRGWAGGLGQRRESDKDLRVSSVPFHTTLVSSKLWKPTSERLFSRPPDSSPRKEAYRQKILLCHMHQPLKMQQRLTDELKPRFTFSHGSLRPVGMSPVLGSCFSALLNGAPSPSLRT